MEENIIRLNSAKNIKTVNVDIEDKLVLESTNKQLIEYDILSSLLVAQQADLERQETLKFRIYGRIDYVSMLHRLKTNFIKISDFFDRNRTNNSRNLINNFDVYLLTPYTGNTSFNNGNYLTNYKVIAKNNDIDIIYGGYGINIFGDRNYIFTNGLDQTTYNMVDSFNKPITKFYLYFNYKSIPNGMDIPQTVERKEFDSSSNENNFTLVNLPLTNYNIGDIVYGDLVSYNKENFLENIINEQEYYITIPYDTNSLKFKYRPFLEIKLRDFSSVDSTANISATTVSNITIPEYAVALDNNGNYLWRDLLDFGYIEPITNLGVDYPFLNGSHYVYNNLILSIIPDLTHENTANVFSEIKFSEPILINTIPSTDINGLGKLC